MSEPAQHAETDAAAEDPMLNRDWKARAAFRARCRRSLYFFTKTVVCATEPRNLMTADVFKASCEWLQDVLTRRKRGLFEDPRNHIKSYRSTVAIPMWVACQRPDERYDHPNEIARANEFLARNLHIKGPDTRIVVASEADTAAGKWVEIVKTQFETNPIMRWAFPELLWDNPNKPDYGRWSNEEIYLPGRSVIYRDGYLRALGIRSKTSGGRADIIIVDDLVSEPSADSPGELAYRCTWLRSITQLVEDRDYKSPSGSAVLYVNNRWNFDDPGSMVHDEMPHWAVWHRAAWVCGVHGRGNCGRQPSDAESDCTPTNESLWGERHPDLDAIRADLGDFVFYTQWGNDPQRKAELDASNLIPARLEVMADDGVRRWHVVIDELRDKASGDLICPAETIPLYQLRGHTISIDPAGADEMSEARKRGKTARWAITWDACDPPTARHFVLNVRAHHWTPDQAIEQCYQAWKFASKHVGKAVGVLCEKVAAQTLVATALRLRAGKDKLRSPEVEMMPPARGLKKWGRIHDALGNRLGNRGLIVIAGDLLLRTEIRHAPQGSLDVLDAVAQAEVKFQELHGVGHQTAARRARRKMNRRMRLARAGVAGV